MRHPWQTIDEKYWIPAIVHQAAGWIARPEACSLAGGLLLVWAVGGRSIRVSEEWQLLIGIGTILAMFVIALLIQNDSRSDTELTSSLPGVSGAVTPHADRA